MTLITAGENQILLPSAEFGDEHTIDGQLKLKKMMDGTKRSHIRTPVIATYSLVFKKMNRNKIEEMRIFLINTAGQQVTLKDWNNHTWIGRITNTPTTFTHAAIRDNQFNIEFEGHRYA